jgi:opacity protein-like surface antigen
MRSVRQLVALFATLVATAALAQAPASAPPGAFQPSSYLQLRLGIFSPQSSDLDGFDSGIALDASFGYRFHPNFAGEVGIGYWRSSASASASGMTASATVSDLPVTASLKAIAPVGSMDLYGLVGFGLHSVKLEASVTGVASGSTTGSAFGFHLGAGLAIPVSASASLGLDLRYLIASPSFNGVSLHVDGLQATGVLLYRF